VPYISQSGAKLLTRDEARRIAVNIAKLPFSRRKACAKLLESVAKTRSGATLCTAVSL
jgi:hypothetical protein